MGLTLTAGRTAAEISPPEPDLTPDMDRYLAEQAKELVAGGQLRAVPDIPKEIGRAHV